MKHLRLDYQGIQDTAGSTSIGEDELVFMVRSKDRNASQTARVWAAYTLRDGGDPAMCARVQEWADEMDEQRATMFHGGKVADVPRDMLLPSNRIPVPVPIFCPHCGRRFADGHTDDCAHVLYLQAIGQSDTEQSQ
jgi:hypothetical protein